MADLLTIILEHIVEIVFGCLGTVGTVFVKKMLNKREQEQKVFRELIRKDISDAMKECAKEDEKLHAEINALKEGMLSVQGKEFKATCEEYLEPTHKLTVAEYEQLIKDHDAYNGLGGNHEGDRLFALVERKAENTLTQN